jgi:hypothetical protein|tara:strand:- start:5138 stop:5596 length:459 start_codon:yes stop_codon:yes gene_type:complete
MARKSRRKKSNKAPMRRKRSQPKGFMQSSSAKSITQALLGAGVAAAADTMPAISGMYTKLPGGSSTVTAVAMVAASMITKKPATKKMLQNMAFGAVGFAVLDYYKERDGSSWNVRQLVGTGAQSGTARMVAAPRTAAPAASVQSIIENSYTN